MPLKIALRSLAHVKAFVSPEYSTTNLDGLKTASCKVAPKFISLCAVHDMFWDQPFDEKAAIKQCQDMFNVTPRPLWATVQ